MRNCFGWLGAVIFVLVGASFLMLLTKGVVAKDHNDDGRTAIILTPQERNLVLSEMREFLESVKIITMGVANKDMKAVQAAGRRMGMAAAGGVPSSLMDKLPDGFKKLAGVTHKGFDVIAMEAEDIGDAKAVLVKLGKVLNNCTTCHAGYRFDLQAGVK